jgi:hypothetical protein
MLHKSRKPKRMASLATFNLRNGLQMQVIKPRGELLILCPLSEPQLHLATPAIVLFERERSRARQLARDFEKLQENELVYLCELLSIDLSEVVLLRNFLSENYPDEQEKDSEL